MPSKTLYTNDIFVIVSLTLSCGVIIFYINWIARHTYLFKQKKTLQAFLETVQKDQREEIKKIVVEIVNASRAFFGALLNILALVFMLLGFCYESQAYGQNGFFFGLIDTSNPARQTYYAFDLIFTGISFIFAVMVIFQMQPKFVEKWFPRLTVEMI
jgi:hypothetical protein